MLKILIAGLVAAAFTAVAIATQTSPAQAGCGTWYQDDNSQWRIACEYHRTLRRPAMFGGNAEYERWGEWGYVDGRVFGIFMERNRRLQGGNGSVFFREFGRRNRNVPRTIDGNLTWSGSGRGVYDENGSWNGTGNDNDADQEFRAAVNLTLSLDRLNKRRLPAPYLDIEFSDIEAYDSSNTLSDARAAEIADKFSIDNIPFRNGRFYQEVQWNGGTTAEVRFYGRKHSYAAGYVRPYKYAGGSVRNQGEAIFITSRDKD